MCTSSGTDDDGQLLDGMDICFVADGSSGLGTRILTQFIQRTNSNHDSSSSSSDTTPPVVLIREPAWMTTLAYLIQVKTFSNKKDDIATVLYALCKLHISAAIMEETNYQIRQQQQHHRPKTNRISTAKTSSAARNKIVITLPGQSSTATLLPLLYRLFPNGTFLFTYDRCVHALTTGISLLKDPSSHQDNQNNNNSNGKANASGNDGNFRSTDYTRTSPSIAATIPISLLHIPGIETALTTLSARHAGIVESWMTSVDSFLSLTKQSSSSSSSSSSSEQDERLIPIDVRTLLTIATTTTGVHTDTSSATSVVDMERNQIINAILPPATNTSNHDNNTADATKIAARSILIGVTNDIASQGRTHNGLLKREEVIAADRCAAVHEGIKKFGKNAAGDGSGSRRFLE